MSWALKTRRLSTGKVRSKDSWALGPRCTKPGSLCWGPFADSPADSVWAKHFPFSPRLLPAPTAEGLLPFTSPRHHRRLCELAGLSFSAPQHPWSFFHLSLGDEMFRNHKSSPPADTSEPEPLLPDQPLPLSVTSSAPGLCEF